MKMRLHIFYQIYLFTQKPTYAVIAWNPGFKRTKI